jgi:hypothetical protein
MRNISRASALIIVSLLIWAPAQRALGNTVFSQLPVTDATSLYSDVQMPQQLADNFTVASATSIASVRWWGVYDAGLPATSDFVLRFFNDNGTAAPALAPFFQFTALNVTRTPTPYSYGPLPTYQFTYNLPLVVPVAAGTPYYLSVLEFTASPSNFAWQGDSPGNVYARSADGQAWSSLPIPNAAFELYNTPQAQVVPLPAAAWMGMALTGGIGVRRKLGGERPSGASV